MPGNGTASGSVTTAPVNATDTPALKGTTIVQVKLTLPAVMANVTVPVQLNITLPVQLNVTVSSQASVSVPVQLNVTVTAESNASAPAPAGEG